MKRKIIFLFIGLLVFFSCKMNIDNNRKNKFMEKEIKKLQSMSKIELLKDLVSDTDIQPAVENEISGISIVKTNSSFDPEIFTALDATVEESFNLSDNSKYWRLRSGEKINAGVLRAILLKTAGVIYAEPDTLIHGNMPSTTIVQNLYNTRSISDGNLANDPESDKFGYSLSTIKATNYYDEDGTTEISGAYTAEGYGENEVVLAVIDSGVDMTHKDFFDGNNGSGKSIMLYAKSAFDIDSTNGSYLDRSSSAPFRDEVIPSNGDSRGHGTHCAGIMAARGDNGVGVTGVAWKNTKLISYQVLNDKNMGSQWAIYSALGDLADIITILRQNPSTRDNSKLPVNVRDYQITQKTVPVNMSIGVGSISSFSLEMINKALAANVLPVVAMGNDGKTISNYPAAIPGTLAVGASDIYDKRAHFSASGSWIDIMAPGKDIVSCKKGNNASNQTEDIVFMNGTSMATPCITGCLGYLLSFDNARDMTPGQLIYVLEQTADKIDKDSIDFGYDSNGFSDYYGYGRVNLLQAVKKIKNGSVDSIYNDSSAVFTMKANNEPIANMKINLYDASTNICVGIGVTDMKGKTEFFGLKNGVQYIAKVNELDLNKSYSFTPNNNQITHEFSYDTKGITYVSTCENTAYPNKETEPYRKLGMGQPWLNIYVYQEGNTVDHYKGVVKKAWGYYPKLSFQAKPNMSYYVVVAAYGNDEKLELQAGNYGLYIGKEIKEFIHVVDGSRFQEDNDSYEPNDTLPAADKIMAENKAKRPYGYWEVEIAGNLIPGEYEGGPKYTNAGEPDIYKFTVPNN